MIDFRPLKIEDRQWIEPILRESKKYGCEYSFGDMFIWKSIYDIQVAKHKDFFVSFNGAGFDAYCCPVGSGNKKEIIEDLMQDARERNIEFKMFGLMEECAKDLEELFPDKFEIEENRDSFDYIYSTEDLINLKGKKYHGKRNHIAYFKKNNNWTYEPMTRENIPECIAMNKEWEKLNREKDPDGIDDELIAINTSFDNFEELGFVGGVLKVEGRVVAFTFGESMNDDIFCTHVEKAYSDIRGAYPMINREFAENALSQYKYINREDDTGLEGLRQAKLSYYPSILLSKYMARLK